MYESAIKAIKKAAYTYLWEVGELDQTAAYYHAMGDIEEMIGADVSPYLRAAHKDALKAMRDEYMGCMEFDARRVLRIARREHPEVEYLFSDAAMSDAMDEVERLVRERAATLE